MIGIGKDREPKTGAFKAFVAFFQHPKSVIHPWVKEKRTHKCMPIESVDYCF